MGMILPRLAWVIVGPNPPRRNGSLDESAPTFTMGCGCARRPTPAGGPVPAAAPTWTPTYALPSMQRPDRRRVGSDGYCLRAGGPRRRGHPEGRVHDPRGE